VRPGGNDLRLKGRAAVVRLIALGWRGANVLVPPVEHKLAAIFAGYSGLMARDEVRSLARLKACRTIIDGLIAALRGAGSSTPVKGRRVGCVEVITVALWAADRSDATANLFYATWGGSNGRLLLYVSLHPRSY
jgi:hypothetical protein